jgi:hypothetical protein
VDNFLANSGAYRALGKQRGLLLFIVSSIFSVKIERVLAFVSHGNKRFLDIR